MIVSEIGLNHLGDSDYADLYLENLINAKIIKAHNACILIEQKSLSSGKLEINIDIM